MASDAGEAFDVLTIGRIGVDSTRSQDGVGLEDVETFGKYLGGSATNVAIAAARHGLRTAVITAIGDDPFGRVRRAGSCGGSASTTVSSRRSASMKTPVTFCEIFPPDDFPLLLLSDPLAPDLMLQRQHLDLDADRSARIYWSTVTGLSREPSRETHHAPGRRVGRAPLTILDLDYRPMFWPSAQAATAEV